MHADPIVCDGSVINQREMKLRGRARLYENPLLLMYDLECSTITGIPFIITFCLLNCITGIFLDIDHPDKIVDKGVPVYFSYDLRYIYRLFRDLIAKCGEKFDMIYLMAYNGNSFDHLYMLNGFRYQYCAINGNNLIGCTFFAMNLKYATRDLRDFITTGNLASIGEQLGVPKLAGDFADLDYAIRDVTIMALAWVRIVLRSYKYLEGVVVPSVYMVVNYRSTAALAFDFVARKCCNYTFSLCVDFNDYFALAYYGGKCDYSVVGTYDDIVMYDICSMYPAAMGMVMPYGEMTYYASLSYIPEFMYIATVTLLKPGIQKICMDSTYGIVPCKVDGATVFATCGHIRTVLTSVDVNNAIVDGWTVLKLEDVIGWCKKGKMFSVYNEMFDIKSFCAKDDPSYWFAKIVLNSSIGKFAGGGDNIPHYINYFCMSYSRSMLVALKCMLTSVRCPYVLYGDTDSIVIREKYMDLLLEKYPFLLNNGMATDMFKPTGAIEVKGDITIVGKKLYWINKDKFSAKGHNRKELNIAYYAECIITGQSLTKRMSPDKSIVLDEERKRIVTQVTPFKLCSRNMNLLYPLYKRYTNGIFIGPNIINVH